MRTVWRYAVRTGLVLAWLTGAGLAMPAPALAANTTELSGLPDEFRAGDRVETVQAVVRRDRGGCVKVRWSMVLTVQGLRLDQVTVDRVEETGSFPLDIRVEGDVARLTDRQLDPGTLCPDRTVTARYRVAFADDVARGRVTLAAEAYDPGLRLLARQTATRSVLGPRAVATPTSAAPKPSKSTAKSTAKPTEPVTEETEGAADREAAEVPPPAELPPAAGASEPVAASGGFGVVQAAFLLGGLLLSLGLGLLLRLRHLTRTAAAGAGADGAGADPHGADADPDGLWTRPRWHPARQ